MWLPHGQLIPTFMINYFCSTNLGPLGNDNYGSI